MAVFDLSKQQVTTTIAIPTVRTLVLGGPVAADVFKALAWMVGIILVFAPLAVHRYRRAV